MFRLTPVVKNLIIVNVIVFFAQILIGDYAIFSRLALFSPNTGAFLPYQLFTYMFVHGGFGHIFFNMLGLAYLGPYLEMVWGFKRFLIFYIVTGIGAALIYLALSYFTSPEAIGVLVGASGAIYGLSMAFGLTYPEVEIFLMFPPITIKAKYLVFVTGIMTFILDRSGKVAHFAHIGGAVVGYFMVRFSR